ncbi:MAG: hypothetical protein ACE5EG_08860 [Thermoanaerobaculia bacterium]
MRSVYRLVAVALLCLLPVVLGCRAIDNPEELQTLAGERPEELPAETTSPPAPTSAATPSDELDAFPLGGSVFPGLGGRLHSSLCDPASDPYSTCM